MRYFAICLGFIATAVACRAEVVVLSNYSPESSGTSMALSTDTPAKIGWNIAGFSGHLSRVKLRILNSGPNTLNVLTLSFGLDASASTITRNYSARGGDIGSTGYSNWEFDLGDLLSVNQGGAGGLYFKVAGQSENAVANWVTTNNSVAEFYGWSGGTTENPASGQFELSAVPEPGTWILMFVAQVMVVGGWVLRKRRALA